MSDGDEDLVGEREEKYLSWSMMRRKMDDFDSMGGGEGSGCGGLGLVVVVERVTRGGKRSGHR